METVLNTPVTLTTNAIKEINRLINEEGFDIDKVLRLGVKGGGCSGLSYVLDFSIPESGDDIFEIDGLKVAINPAHSIYLFGMEVNYEDGLNSRGFVFKNPNASKTCGCGSSFAV